MCKRCYRRRQCRPGAMKLRVLAQEPRRGCGLMDLVFMGREREGAAVCMTIQEIVEGTSNRSTVGKPQDFLDWGRRWGTDDPTAQLTLQCYWDNILWHIMGITAATNVWEPPSPSSIYPSQAVGDMTEGEVALATAAAPGHQDKTFRPHNEQETEEPTQSHYQQTTRNFELMRETGAQWDLVLYGRQTCEARYCTRSTEGETLVTR